jgi:hypothetical protein
LVLIEGWFVVNTEVPASTEIFTFSGFTAYRDMYAIAAKKTSNTAHILKIARDGYTLVPDGDALPNGTYAMCMVIDTNT